MRSATLALVVAIAAPAQTSAQGILGLPVVEVRASGGSGTTMAVMLSGDGGWAAGDRSMAAALADSGISVVGLDVPSYLRTPRTPDRASADLLHLLSHYLTSWRATRVILIGYSHGADLAPFMVSGLPQDVRGRIALLAMLGLGHTASFEYHLADIISDVSHNGALPVLPEVKKLRGLPMLCVQGANEENSLCSSLPEELARVETRAGGHRVSEDQGPGVIGLILRVVRSAL
jgi:type IV secretory pathway VirJ component